MDNLSYLKVPNRSDVPENVETLFQKFEAKLGMLPNMPQIFALTPEHFLKWFSYYAMFNFTNRLANALGWKPNPEYYAMHR